ncbi:MAG: hypothetical protein RLO52_31780 [Sandaracinaceae bacterium]|nr:hypothetical protein [Myxococcales bacterium]
MWEDMSPAIKGVVVVGGLLVVYLIIARFAQIIPFSCQDGAHCEGILCGECVVEEGQRGFSTDNAVGAETAE